MKSLGRRVPAEWVAREMKTEMRLAGKSDVFPIVDDHLILRFKSELDCASMRKGRPWFVTGQLLAMKPWEPDFVLGRRPILKTVVWLRLPGYQ